MTSPAPMSASEFELQADDSAESLWARIVYLMGGEMPPQYVRDVLQARPNPHRFEATPRP
jgi:hypothetical protein